VKGNLPTLIGTRPTIPTFERIEENYYKFSVRSPVSVFRCENSSGRVRSQRANQSSADVSLSQTWNMPVRYISRIS